MIKEQMIEAIKQMQADGEFDKIAKYPTSSIDRAESIALKLQLEKVEDLDKIPVIPLIMSINSADVWKNIITRMIASEPIG